MIGIKIISLRTPLVSNDLLCRRYSGINFFSIWYQILTRAIMTLRDGLTEIGQVDVSIGIASYPQHTQSDSLLRAADAALYRAKELGRSRIVSFGRLKTR